MICTKVRISDHVSIINLHATYNIVSLEQRRRQQLLMLMYKKSSDHSMHSVFLVILGKYPHCF